MLHFKDKIKYKLPPCNGIAAHLDGPAYAHMGQIEHLTANLAVVALAEGRRISDDWERRAERVAMLLAVGDMLSFGSHLEHPSKASLYKM